jgi:hypothetical protein
MPTAATGALLGGALLAVLLGACGSDGGGALEVPPGSTTPAGLPAVATVAPPTHAPKAAGTTGRATSTSDDGKPESIRAIAIHASFRMPNVVGMNLQAAQDKLQSLGSYLMDQQDASGRHRIQVLDSDWKVCTQEPAAGRTVLATTVVRLASVKLNERCP